jgi:adenine-specific DNA-methyltransferase
MTQAKKQNDTRLNLASHDAVGEHIESLKLLIPEAFVEEKLDIELLRQHLGDFSKVGTERYGLNWAGKADAIRSLQIPSYGTLVPLKDQSVKFDESENMIIEGDNLEVLKLLQKSYHSKIKMIYIDPPYNTGGDFIYPDNFKEGLDTYLRYSGQATEQGFKVSTNSENGGRYHSNWLNMMYPRLFLAKNLLKDDGVIFVSINDKEVHNLKAIMNEIFGEENFITTLIWDKGHSAQAGIFKVYHEYIHVYGRNLNFLGTPTSEDSENFEAGALKRPSNRHPVSEFTFPAGVRFEATDGVKISGEYGGIEKIEVIDGVLVCENGKTKSSVTLKAAWTQKNQMQQYFYGDRDSLVDSRGQKIVEFYFTGSGKVKIVKERGVYTPDTTLDYGTQSQASTELADLFELDESPIDNPKPPKMLRDFVAWFTDEDDIILDFFAGSGSTGQAVIDLNAEKNTKRKFILVQLPESTTRKKEDGAIIQTSASKAGYKTIAEVCRERIRRVHNKYKDELNLSDTDFGSFKSYKLTASNFKLWDGGAVIDQISFAKQLELYADNILPGRNQDDILYEVVLKAGQPLTAKIEKIEIAGQQVFSIGGAMLICLEDPIKEETLVGMLEYQPAIMVTLDKAFHGNDQLKTNIKLQAEATGESEQSRVLFKTV